MLDILGFRQMVQASRASEIARRVEKLFEIIPHNVCSWGTFGDNDNESGTTELGHAQFSDTILMWTPSLDNFSEIRKQAEIANLLTATSQLILHGFLSGLPLRAGLAFGECYINPSTQTYVGQAIVDAHVVESQQEWVGGALDPKSFAEIPIDAGFSMMVIAYSVPVKTNSAVHPNYSLNWTAPAQYPVRFARREFGVSVRRLLRESLHKYRQAKVSESVQKKYANTASFVEFSLRIGVRSWRDSQRRMRSRHAKKADQS